MKQTPPKSMELSALAQLVNEDERVEVILADAPKWITWESALTLQMKEVKVLKVEPEERLPLYISMGGSMEEADNIPYDEEMRFILRLC